MRKLKINKRSISVVLFISISTLVAAIFLFNRYKQENRTLDLAARELINASNEVSNIVPNFIYLSKKMLPTEQTLMSEIVKIRFELTQNIQSSTKDLSPNVVLLTEKLITQNTQLVEKLEKVAEKNKDKQLAHIKELKNQWQLRTTTFQKVPRTF